MMKRGWTLLALGLILAAQVAASRAAWADPSRPAGTKVAAKDAGKVQEYSFDGQEIDGTYLSPQMGAIETVRRSHTSLLMERMDFRDRLIESVNDL